MGMGSEMVCSPSFALTMEMGCVVTLYNNWAAIESPFMTLLFKFLSYVFWIVQQCFQIPHPMLYLRTFSPYLSKLPFPYLFPLTFLWSVSVDTGSVLQPTVHSMTKCCILCPSQVVPTSFWESPKNITLSFERGKASGHIWGNTDGWLSGLASIFCFSKRLSAFYTHENKTYKYVLIYLIFMTT